MLWCVMLVMLPVTYQRSEVLMLHTELCLIRRSGTYGVRRYTTGTTVCIPVYLHTIYSYACIMHARDVW